MIEIPVLSVCGPLGVGNDLSVSEVGLLATVVGVILTVLFGVAGVALITVVRVAVLSSVVEGALLIAAVVRSRDSSFVPTGKGGMNERRMILSLHTVYAWLSIVRSMHRKLCFYN